MMIGLVEEDVVMTSSLPVFEMDVPGRPTIEKRVLDTLTSDARIYVLNNKVRASDQARIHKLYGTDSSPWSAAFTKEMEFDRHFPKTADILLPALHPPGLRG